MPVITMAMTKGGCGKTTTALILGGEVVRAGGRVVFIEGDVNRPLATWAKNRGAPVLEARKLAVNSAADARRHLDDQAGGAQVAVVTTEDDDSALIDWIEGASTWASWIILDPEGSPNRWMLSAMAKANLVLVPFAPTTIDAQQIAPTVNQIRHMTKVVGRTIPYRLLLVRSNAIPTRSERDIRARIEEAGLPLLTQFIMDRPAFREIIAEDCFAWELDGAKINGLEKAKANAQAVAQDIISAIAFEQKAQVAA